VVWIVAFLMVFVAAMLVLLFVTTRDEGSRTAPTTTPSSRTTPTTASAETSVPTTTGPSSTVAPSDATTAVWPFAEGTTRYADPVAAARGFAVDFVSFTDPVVGGFRQGDTRSGEVDVQPRVGGPVATVLVRQLGRDGTWWVLGAATANIVLREPAAGALLSSPVRLRGASSAFEGTVSTQVRQDGAIKPLGSGFVTGGSGIELGSFDGTLAFSRPTAASGAVVLSTISSETGRVSEVTVVRVRFSGA
jgi:hypothetical protein